MTDRSKIEDGKWVSVAIMIAAWTHIIVLKFYQSNKLQFHPRISTCPYSFKARPQECVFSLLISIPVHDRLRISEIFPWTWPLMGTPQRNKLFHQNFLHMSIVSRCNVSITYKQLSAAQLVLCPLAKLELPQMVCISQDQERTSQWHSFTMRLTTPIYRIDQWWPTLLGWGTSF